MTGRGRYLVALVRGYADEHGVAALRQDTLMSLFGRNGDPQEHPGGDPARGQARRPLAPTRPHHRAAYRYRLAVVARPGNGVDYDEAPWSLIGHVAGRKASPEHVRTWQYVDDAVDNTEGWARFTARELADAAGIGAVTARRHVKKLAELGVTEVTNDIGRLDNHPPPVMCTTAPRPCRPRRALSPTT
jgi:hypothetical protein